MTREVVQVIKCNFDGMVLGDDDPIEFVHKGNTYSLDVCSTHRQLWLDIMDNATLTKKKPGRPKGSRTKREPETPT